jgi:hypothetical protein
MASAGGAPRVRLLRVLVVTFVLSTAALGWLFGPQVWAMVAADDGPLARAKRRVGMWVGIAQWKDKRIKNVSRALGGQPPKTKPKP